MLTASEICDIYTNSSDSSTPDGHCCIPGYCMHWNHCAGKFNPVSPWL